MAALLAEPASAPKLVMKSQVQIDSQRRGFDDSRRSIKKSRNLTGLA